MWDYAEHRCAATPFFNAQQRRTRLAFRCPVLFQCSYNEAKMSTRVPRRIMLHVFLSTEVRRCTCAHSCRGCLEKAMPGETRAMHIHCPLPLAASASRSRIHGGSITGRSIASRRRRLHRYLANEIFCNSEVLHEQRIYRHGSLISDWHNDTIALMRCCL